MKKNLTTSDFKEMIFNMSQVFTDNLQLLSKLDSTIGDGDHGVTISRGFKQAAKQIKKSKPDSIKQVLIQVSKSLMSKMGGASGPLFGTLFREMGKYIGEDKKSVDVSDLTQMLSSSLNKIINLGKSKPGDKTMVDVLDPVVSYLKDNQEQDLVKVFGAISEIAKNSAERTKEMIAKKGRARYLGERSLGHQDPGATSIYLIIKSMKKAIIKED